MKKYIVPSVALIACVITICLCVFSRGRKAKIKPENKVRTGRQKCLPVTYYSKNFAKNT